VTRAYLSRLERFQSELNCFLSTDRERALGEVRAADAAVVRGDLYGSLHGVPLAHRDIFYRKGSATTCGSRLFRSDIAYDTSTTFVRLLKAGRGRFLSAP
jgi:aspartyl-tRNA(Asn)/glutamyl-tRNA(Gln) amidotransferase subunit A